jgi:alanine-glyoxylate transaminase/serine-glyoxylate transaminase/serine-pyruvate transaminase
MDVRSIARVAKEKSPSTLVIVDGVCSTGAEELRMDEWDVDGVVTASQKALGAPSGLAIAVVSQRAIKTYETRKTIVANYFASCKQFVFG